MLELIATGGLLRAGFEAKLHIEVDAFNPASRFPAKGAGFFILRCGAP
jgi:hypothetical protein